jgi:hypothetical protein
VDMSTTTAICKHCGTIIKRVYDEWAHGENLGAGCVPVPEARRRQSSGKRPYKPWPYNR